MTKIRLDKLLLYILFLLIFFLYLNSNSYFLIESIFFVVSSLILIMLLLVTTFKTKQMKFTNQSKYIIFFIVLIVAYMLILYIYKSNFEGTVPIVYALLYYLIILNYPISNKEIKFLFFLFSVLILVWLGSINNYYDYFMISIYDLKINVLNSNILAMILLMFFIFIYSYLLQMNCRKNIRFSLLILFTWMIYNTHSRGTLIALMFYIILNSLSNILFRKEKYVHMVLIIIFIISILLPFLYMNLEDFFTSDINIVGKSMFSGRELIWKDFFNVLTQNPTDALLGVKDPNLFAYVSNDGSNLHNWYLKMIFTIGYLGIMIYYGVFFTHVHLMYKNKPSVFQISLFCGFLSILVNSMSEVFLFSYTVSGVCFIILGLSSHKNLSSKEIQL